MRVQDFRNVTRKPTEVFVRSDIRKLSGDEMLETKTDETEIGPGRLPEKLNRKKVLWIKRTKQNFLWIKRTKQTKKFCANFMKI